MLNEVYIAVQALANKDFLGYLKPLEFNSFASVAQRKEYDKLFSDHKTEVRKQNWMLDGKDFANIAEYKAQLIEYFLKEVILPTTLSGVEVTVSRPDDCEFIQDLVVKSTGQGIEKVSYTDYKLLLRNIYANPSNCLPTYSLVGNTIKISPNSIENIKINYLRHPKTPKWTFQEVADKAYFDPTASDYQDFDLPQSSYNNLVRDIAIMFGVNLRDAMPIQVMQAENQMEMQTKNQQ